MKPNHKNVEGYGGQNNELLLEQAMAAVNE